MVVFLVVREMGTSLAMSPGVVPFLVENRIPLWPDDFLWNFRKWYVFMVISKHFPSKGLESSSNKCLPGYFKAGDV